MLQSTASCYSQGPGEFCCAVTEQLRGGEWWKAGVGGGGDFLLSMLLGVNTSVKRWVTAQCGGCERSAARSPAAVILPLLLSRELSLKHGQIQG